jgi:hypothetical protein
MSSEADERSRAKVKEKLANFTVSSSKDSVIPVRIELK